MKMKTRVRVLVRGAVVSFAAITLAFTVAVTPAEAATPVISGFSPLSGAPGTVVSVTGNGFTGGVAGVSAVSFNNVATTFNVSNDQHLTATVPVGATTGRIRVTTSDGVGMSLTDFVVLASPTISSFSPSSGAPGTAVTINGTNFIGVNGVRFNGTSATFNFVSNTQVMSSVPAGATTGKITVTTASGTATSGPNFTVTGSTVPTISSFSPSSGIVGTSVTINGNHFTGASSVRFNGTSASFSVANDGRITAVVPGGATTGRITVTTPSGTATSASNFTVTGGSAPTISSFSPSSGAAGTSVTINGNRFAGATSVRFNGTSASFSVANDGRITAVVPTGATTGRITVTTASGTATSGSNFTVIGGGNHDRSVVLSISGRYASGHVGVNDGYAACSSNVPVVIKRLHHGEWHWVTTTSTHTDGDYRALIGGKNGRYRAKAKKITLVNGTICEGQQSSTVQHH
jgi:hypothetical protein